MKKITLLISIILILGIASISMAASVPRNVDTTYITDKEGDYVSVTDGGAFDVFVQDPTSDIIDLYFHEHTGPNIVLTSGTELNDTVIDVQAGYSAVPGNLICLKEGAEYYQGIIISNTTTTITLDSPLDYTFTAGSNCSPTSKEMAVDGSSVTRTFHIQPPTGATWHITRVLFFINGTGAMDSGKFGDQDPFVKGVVLRKKDGDYKNIFNVKSNGDWANRAYDISYDDKAPAGTTALRVRRTFGGQSKNGAVIELDGATFEELELLIQDDATGVGNFWGVVQGHRVVD